MIHPSPIVESPEMLYVFVTNKCNIRCAYCDRKNVNQIGWDVEDEFLQKQLQILEEAPSVKLIDVTGYGEFLLSRHRDVILDVCKRRNIRFQFVTNGSPVTALALDRCIDSGLYCINLSIISFDPEIRKQICGFDHVDLVDKVARLLGANRHRGYRYNMSMVVNSLNRHEIRKFGDYAREVGADQATVAKMIRTNAEWCPEHEIEWDAKIQEDVDYANYAILWATSIITPVEESENWVCPAPFREFVVSSDSAVKPCCYLPDMVMGYLVEQPWSDILNCEKWQQLRESLISGSYEHCQHCPIYQQNYGAQS